MTAASIYTAKLHTNEPDGWYGHCYILAWISFVLGFLLAITYLVLRKKNDWKDEKWGQGWDDVPLNMGNEKKGIYFKSCKKLKQLIEN